MHLGDLVEEVMGEIEEQDWESVLRDASYLYTQSARKSKLAQAASDTTALALFILEHPVFEECYTSLSNVAIASLEDGWDSYGEKRR